MINIILDTDIGSDCDDAGALGLLHSLAYSGEACIVGILHSNLFEYGPAAIDVINKYYGRQTEIGIYKGVPHSDRVLEDKFAEEVSKKFSLEPLKRSDCEEAAAYLKRKLGALDGKCKLVCIGQLSNARNLLFSEGGAGLFVDKIEEVVIMGGLFRDNPDCGKYNDIDYWLCEHNICSALKDSREFIHNCPVKITFCDFILGRDVKTLGHITNQSEENPVAYCYNVYAGGSRESWDLLAVLYAVRGLGKTFNESEKGTVNVTPKGETVFKSEPQGLHSYLRLKLSERETENFINNFFK